MSASSARSFQMRQTLFISSTTQRSMHRVFRAIHFRRGPKLVFAQSEKANRNRSWLLIGRGCSSRAGHWFRGRLAFDGAAEINDQAVAKQAGQHGGKDQGQAHVGFHL